MQNPNRKLLGRAKKDSKYRRVKRFFRSFQINAFTTACLITQLLPIREAAGVLVMDRTNWKLGKETINVLMLGIAHQGIAFPIFMDAVIQNRQFEHPGTHLLDGPVLELLRG